MGLPGPRRARAQLHALYEASPAGILATDLDQRITGCNRAFAVMVGLTPEEVVGRRGPEFFQPDGPAPDVVVLADLVAGMRDTSTGERLLRRGDGSRLPVRIDASVVRCGRRRTGLVFVVSGSGARRPATPTGG